MNRGRPGDRGRFRGRGTGAGPGGRGTGLGGQRGKGRGRAAFGWLWDRGRSGGAEGLVLGGRGAGPGGAEGQEQGAVLGCGTLEYSWGCCPVAGSVKGDCQEPAVVPKPERVTWGQGGGCLSSPKFTD